MTLVYNFFNMIVILFFIATIVVVLRVIFTVQYWITSITEDPEEDEMTKRLDAAIEKKVDKFKENLLAKLEG